MTETEIITMSAEKKPGLQPGPETRTQEPYSKAANLSRRKALLIASLVMHSTAEEVAAIARVLWRRRAGL